MFSYKRIYSSTWLTSAFCEIRNADKLFIHRLFNLSNDFIDGLSPIYILSYFAWLYQTIYRLFYRLSAF